MARHFVPDDRHQITDPYADPDRWARSVTQGRIADLFLTAQGLVGHAAQVQQEIKRIISANNLGKMEGMTGADVVDLIGALEVVKSAIVAAANAADAIPRQSLPCNLIKKPCCWSMDRAICTALFTPCPTCASIRATR